MLKYMPCRGETKKSRALQKATKIRKPWMPCYQGVEQWVNQVGTEGPRLNHQAIKTRAHVTRIESAGLIG
jgi:hypothetical protein